MYFSLAEILHTSYILYMYVLKLSILGVFSWYGFKIARTSSAIICWTHVFWSNQKGKYIKRHTIHIIVYHKVKWIPCSSGISYFFLSFITVSLIKLILSRYGKIELEHRCCISMARHSTVINLNPELSVPWSSTCLRFPLHNSASESTRSCLEVVRW